MILGRNGVAVLGQGRDGLLSRWCEEEGLCHDRRVIVDYCPLIPVGGVVVDAGAAIGDHTIAYLDRVGPEGTVYAFEPNPEMFECLTHNCPRAICFNMGLSSHPESRFMVHNKENAGASFVSDDHSGFPVTLSALDCMVMPRLDFIKMDIEGMELAALAGAMNTITRCKPKIVMEINRSALERQGASFEKICTFLDSVGYTYRLFLGELNTEQFELLAEPNHGP